MNATLYTTEILRLAASLSEPRALDREDGTAEIRSKLVAVELALWRPVLVIGPGVRIQR